MVRTSREACLSVIVKGLMNQPFLEPEAHDRHPGGLKLYAWAVTACTLLLLGLVLWPLSVSTFRSTARFHLDYAPDSGLEKATLNRLVLDSFHDQTSAESIARLLQDLRTPVTSPLLQSNDPTRLRAAIDILGKPGEIANSVEYQAVFTGQGSPDELEFLNRFLVALNARLDSRLAENNTSDVVDDLAADFSRFHAGAVEQAADRIDEVLRQVETAADDIMILSSDLQALPGAPAANSPARRPRVFAAVAQTPKNSRLEELLAERERLLAIPGMTRFHVQVTSIQKQIEDLRQSTDVTGFINDGGNMVVQNRFATGATAAASAGPAEFGSSLETVRSGIQAVDLQTPLRDLANLQQQLNDSDSTIKTVAQRIRQRAEGRIRVQSPVTITDFRKATASVPVGGVPTGRNLLWLGLFSGLVASLVALNFDPHLKTRRFRSVSQLQAKLGLPLLGVVQSTRSARQTGPARRLVATRIVKLCEWTLLAIALLLVVAALLNSQVAVAFLENPFHGLTRTVWLFTSRGG